jgi:GDPmannose 4,6-dehydratase
VTWRGGGADETGHDDRGRRIVAVDRHYFRPTEVDSLLGDPSKAREKLGWKSKVSFRELIAEMVQSDLELAKRDALVRANGYKVMDHHE